MGEGEDTAARAVLIDEATRQAKDLEDAHVPVPEAGTCAGHGGLVSLTVKTARGQALCLRMLVGLYERRREPGVEPPRMIVSPYAEMPWRKIVKVCAVRSPLAIFAFLAIVIVTPAGQRMLDRISNVRLSTLTEVVGR